VNLNDKITWSEKPVLMTPDIFNPDGSSIVKYHWTLDPDSYDYNQLQIEISDPCVLNSTITVTKDSSYIHVGNPGFEQPVIPDDDVDPIRKEWQVPSWISMGMWGDSVVWNYHNDVGGALNPAEEEFDYIPDGKNVGWVEIGTGGHVCLYQGTGVTIEAGKTYTLSAMVGNPAKNGGPTSNHYIEIVGSGLGAASESAASPDPCEWTFVTISYTAGADEVADPNVGQTLGLRLAFEPHALTPGGDYHELNFDNVQLAINGVSGTEFYDVDMFTVAVTLEVGDETNEAVSDSMTIDVYDTVCIATRVGLGETKAGDINEDCLVNIVDMALMAQKWLDDSSAEMTPVEN
jgi:hypothetical protein